jgi:hypothetical protein
LKLSDVRGWSVFVEDPGRNHLFSKIRFFEIGIFLVQMQAVYIPEDDRCTDILGLVEDEDNLKYYLPKFLLIK